MSRIAASVATIASVVASGATALVYQAALTRYLARFVGSDHVAAGITLGVFLVGLALGALVQGRLSVAMRRPLAFYAAVEFAVGAWALSFPAISRAFAAAVSSWSFAPPGMLLVQGLAAAALVVLPPTLLMGGTVPLLTRALVRGEREVSSLHAALYAANTAGAVAGVLGASFWLIPHFGITATIRGTGGVNLAIGACFGTFALFRSQAIELSGVRSRAVPTLPRLHTARIYGIGLLNGLSVLLLETALLRFTSLALGGSAYMFALVVAVFLLALAAGSLLVSRLPTVSAGWLWGSQAAAAGCLLALYASLDRLPYYAHLLRIGFQGGPSGFYLYHVAVLLALTALFVIPIGLLGTTLPLLFHELRASVSDAGALSGRLLAWNGLGTLSGALAGSFALYDLLDLPRVFLLAVATVAGNALLAAWTASRNSRAVAGTALMVAVAILAARPWYEDDRLVVGTYRIRGPLASSFEGPRAFFDQQLANSRVVARDDDATASVAVVEHPASAPGAPQARSLVVNGRSESNTIMDAATLRLSAHIPALWAPRRDRVLLVGLGTGVTAANLALYDDLGSLEVAEISPNVIRFLPHFSGFTDNVERDPRLHVRLADATLVVRQTEGRFDLVISEPSNPWTAGADTLFTREFYRSVRDRLSEDGLFLQWVQLYESDFRILGMILNTLRQEFPAVHAFRGSRGDLLVLAGKRPFTPEDRMRAERVLAENPRAAAALAEIDVHSVRDILAREVQSLPIVFEQTRHFGINTADHPRLLYLAGRAMFSGAEVSEEMLRHGQTDFGALFR